MCVYVFWFKDGERTVEDVAQKYISVLLNV